MAKYNVGDKFVATITDVDDSGMGTLYTLNGCLNVSFHELDKMELQELPLSEEVDIPKAEEKTYTPEDLMSRILTLSRLLNETIDKYLDIKAVLETGVPNLDEQIERLSL